MKNQGQFFDDVIEEPTSSETKKKSCKYHRYAMPGDFIEVLVKKTNKMVLRCKYCERERRENKKIRTADWSRNKEEVTDYYVRTTLKVGKHGIKGDIPEPLIEAKRAVIKLKNLSEKMNQPLKKCSKHGKLYRDDVIRSGKNKSGDVKWKCKRCMKDMHKKHYELNKASVLAAHARYRDKNPEKVRAVKINSRLKKRQEELIKSRERWERYEKRNKEVVKKREQQWNAAAKRELKDCHVRWCLVKRSGLKTTDIPDELVQAKKAIMLLKRGTKRRIEDNKLLELKERNENVKDK